MLSDTEQIELLSLLEQSEAESIVPILEPVRLATQGRYRIVCIHGGRGSGKSIGVAKILVSDASENFRRILCCREIWESIRESSYSLIVDTIDIMKKPGWKILDREIRHNPFYGGYGEKNHLNSTGSKFTFTGLKDLRAGDNIKSYYKYHIAWIEEAHAVSRENLEKLEPTIREPGSWIVATFNRYQEFDPVFEKWCLSDNDWLNYNDYIKNRILPVGNILVILCNWRHNPWFPEVLRSTMEKNKKEDYDLYLHTWEGEPIAQLEKAVISRQVVNSAIERHNNDTAMQRIGVDIARFGEDKSVAYESRGLKIRELAIAKKIEPIEFAYRVAEKTDNLYVPIIVDKGGLGAGGFIDMLRKLGYENVIEISFNGVAKNKERYHDIISEIWFEGRDSLRYADIENNKELKQDLTGRLYGYTIDGKIKIEEKDKFKKRYKRSPDRGEAALLSMYDPDVLLKMSETTKQSFIKLRNRKRKNKILF